MVRALKLFVVIPPRALDYSLQAHSAVDFKVSFNMAVNALEGDAQNGGPAVSPYVYSFATFTS